MTRIAAILIVLAGLAAGCVEREMRIDSQPAGAVVYISGQEVGRTPLVHRFTWYGDYDITLRKDGYETLKTHAEINPPVYEWPGLDLLSELAPWTYRDVRYLDYQLQPFTPTEPSELIERAIEMREEALEEVR
ncbi:MAG: PEGA domain-containing protein [Phycisphaerae bacterium]